MTLRAEVEASIQAVLYTLTAVAAIAALTLVTTIMVSSVMERTGEIGLRNDAGERKFLSRYWVLGFRY